MNTLNAVLTTTTDWLLAPVSNRPLTALLICAAATGVLAALVYRFTSNQRALNRVADRSQAELLAINLFYDNFRNTFVCFGRLCRLSVLRLYFSMPPMLVMFVPFTLLMSQLALRYEFRPLTAGEAVVVELRLARGSWQKYQNATISVPRHFTLETPAVRDAVACTVAWRIRIKKPIAGVVAWQIGPDEKVTKSVPVAQRRDQLCATNVCRSTLSWWQQIAHPGEPMIDPDSPVLSARIQLPHRSTPVFGRDVPWWLTFLFTTIAAALLVRPVFRIRF